MTATLARPRVHGEVVRRLALAILEGDWAPGERLPNQADYCACVSLAAEPAPT